MVPKYSLLSSMNTYCNAYLSSGSWPLFHHKPLAMDKIHVAFGHIYTPPKFIYVTGYGKGSVVIL